jgi:hypothetical protein
LGPAEEVLEGVAVHVLKIERIEHNAAEPQPIQKQFHLVNLFKSRGNPLWLPILRAATGGRPYVYFLKNLTVSIIQPDYIDKEP